MKRLTHARLTKVNDRLHRMATELERISEFAEKAGDFYASGSLDVAVGILARMEIFDKTKGE